LEERCLRKNPMQEYWDTPRYVRNFERGLKMACDKYFDGKDLDHVVFREDDADGLRWTMENELFAREERRRKMERHHLKWCEEPTTIFDQHLGRQITTFLSKSVYTICS
jgi:hypothetical protein